MNKPENNSVTQKLTYAIELPAQFTSWNAFYDELTRLGLIQDSTDVIRINVFRSADSVQDGESFSQRLTYERQHIERMCLAELRLERSTKPGHWLSIVDLEQLIRIVSRQATHLTDWDLLVKLNERLLHEQQQTRDKSDSQLAAGE